MSWRTLGIAFFALSGCDGVALEPTTTLVVEGYAIQGEPLPTVRLGALGPLDESYSGGIVTGAAVRVGMDAQWHDYRMGSVGEYLPLTGTRVPNGSELTLEVEWEGNVATAKTQVPPPLEIGHVEVKPTSSPVSGLILDSLFIDPSQLDTIRFDSLRTGASVGLVYLVEVTMNWQVDPGEEDVFWIRTELRPKLESRSRLDDYFLRPEQLQREVLIPLAGDKRTWTGVYAVPVEGDDPPLPPHQLRVAVVRGTHAYAQFVSGSDNPRLREPLSNVNGALGIFTGIAVDSLSVWVQ